LTTLDGKSSLETSNKIIKKRSFYLLRFIGSYFQRLQMQYLNCILLYLQ